jgi:hypothetical protein
MAYDYPTADFQTSTLSGAIVDGANSMTIGTGLDIPATNGVLHLDYDNLSSVGLGVADGPEVISYTAYNTATGAVTGMTRGLAGTTDVDHSNGATVQSGPSSLYLIQLNAAIAAAGVGSEWVATGETWVYATANTVTVSGDQTAKYQKGDKVKLDNDGSTKYFIIDITPTYGAPNTTITLRPYVGGTVVVNSAITNNYYSRVQTPLGFPDTPKSSAKAGAAQNNINNAWVQVVLGTENYDIGANFATNAFTAPCTGYYQVNSGISWSGAPDGATTTFSLGIYVDDTYLAGTTLQNVQSYGGGAMVSTAKANFSKLFYLTAGQTVKLYQNHNDATDVVDIAASEDTFLDVSLI